MKLRYLLELFVLYSHNIKVVHWNSVGKQFDRIHELADKYYGMFIGSTDTIGEILEMLGYDIPSFLDIVKELGDDTKSTDVMVIDGTTKHNLEDGVKIIAVMLSSITDTVTKILQDSEIMDPDNVGIKSTLENIQYEYAKELMYFNKCRME